MSIVHSKMTWSRPPMNAEGRAVRCSCGGETVIIIYRLYIRVAVTHEHGWQRRYRPTPLSPSMKHELTLPASARRRSSSMSSARGLKKAQRTRGGHAAAGCCAASAAAAAAAPNANPRASVSRNSGELSVTYRSNCQRRAEASCPPTPAQSMMAVYLRNRQDYDYAHSILCNFIYRRE